jgi:hypothetical protein
MSTLLPKANLGPSVPMTPLTDSKFATYQNTRQRRNVTQTILIFSTVNK